MTFLLAIIIAGYTGSAFVLLYKAGKEKSGSANRLYTYIQSVLFLVAALLFSTILYYLVNQE